MAIHAKDWGQMMCGSAVPFYPDFRIVKGRVVINQGEKPLKVNDYLWSIFHVRSIRKDKVVVFEGWHLMGGSRFSFGMRSDSEMLQSNYYSR